MIASQNVVGTTTTAKCDGIGPGGLTPSPTTACATAVATPDTTTVSSTSTSPFIGWPIALTKPGLPPHSTTATTCIGIRPSMKKDTHPRNVPTGNNEIKASAITITSALATSPSAGCFTADPPVQNAYFVPFSSS